MCCQRRGSQSRFVCFWRLPITGTSHPASLSPEMGLGVVVESIPSPSSLMTSQSLSWHSPMTILPLEMHAQSLPEHLETHNPQLCFDSFVSGSPAILPSGVFSLSPLGVCPRFQPKHIGDCQDRDCDDTRAAACPASQRPPGRGSASFSSRTTA